MLKSIFFSYPFIGDKVENKDIVAALVSEYITLKEHEYKSISVHLKNKPNNFKSRVEYNTFNNYKDTHITLTYSYTTIPIREDKYFHTLNDELIDILHFTRGNEPLLDKLIKEIKLNLKDYKVTNDMIELVISLNKDNFYVLEDGLLFIYSYNQFGINSLSDFRVKIKYEDLYEHI